jgi:hypothetical protein
LQIIKKNKLFLVLLFLFFLSLIPLFLKVRSNSCYINNNNKTELFSPHLLRLNSIPKLKNYIDSIYFTQSHLDLDTAKYVALTSETLKKRFRYGLSNYNLSENWIAYLCSKIFWDHFSAIVNPNDILKYPEGICSQQTIVFMEILKQKHINFRSVGLGPEEGPGHFLSEVYYQNSWHLYDITLEPKWNKIQNSHFSLSYYLENKKMFYYVYDTILSKKLYSTLLSRIEYGEPNVFPAKKMWLFHKFTLYLTYLFPIFILLFLIKLAIKK